MDPRNNENRRSIRRENKGRDCRCSRQYDPVYEGAVSQNLFTIIYSTLPAIIRRTIQGEQSRYFMYDSLGRVLYSKQPEQDPNSF
jgi:hypothetical protein